MRQKSKLERERVKMIHNKFFGHLFSGIYILIFISSCALPISKHFRQEAAPNVTFPMVFQHPAAYKGSVVIWGGVIIKTTSFKNGIELFVLETPLGSGEKPKGIDYARGRFIAISSSYLEPLAYHKGRKVTLAGEVVGERKIVVKPGRQSYIFPVVKIKELHLWKKARAWYPAYYPPYYYGGYAPYYWGGGPFGDEFYGDFGDEGFNEGVEEGNGAEEGR